MKALQDIYQCVVDGEMDEVESLIYNALNAGCTAKEILDDGLLAGMAEVGEQFKVGDMFVPEVLVAAKTMDIGMTKIKPLLQSGDIKEVGTILFATVKGDLHDIGKKLVCMMLEGAGYKIIDLGVDVSPEAICEGVKEYKPDLVGLSAMLTTTTLSMKETADTLKQAGLYDSVKIMVGGAPVNQKIADEFGGHYSTNASTAVELANELMK